MDTAFVAPMASSSMGVAEGSSGYQPLPLKCGERTGLPLIPCPDCGEEILELVAGSGSKVPGAIFFKCRLHERDVSFYLNILWYEI